MYAIEFEATINNGIVQIPEIYKELQINKKAKIIVMIDDAPELEQHSMVFDDFLKTSSKVENIEIFSRDALHER